MITASHNPKEYNGFKMIKKAAGRIEAIRGTFLSRRLIIRRDEAADFPEAERKGRIKDIDIWPDYLKHVFSFVDIDEIKPFKAAVDAGNGMAGKVVPLLSEKLPVNIISLNFNLDGNFPAHPSNPLAKGAANQVSMAVKENKADCGFIFDGDADRIFLIDESGNFVGGDIAVLLLAKYFLRKNPGKGIAYNLIYSRAVPEFIKKWGGAPIRTKVGYVNIWEEMMKNDGIMGGELSGHFSFRDSFYTDSGFISFLVLLQIISESEKSVSELAKELSPYFKLPEINFKIGNKEAVLKKIRERFSDGKQDYLDGVTVEYNDWWFNVRPSQTEPLLRLTIEADSKELLEEKKKELVGLIKESDKN
jgi:phosphomannomutase